MQLYEITTGSTGESYERCYVWTYGEEMAVDMFKAKYPNAKVHTVKEIMHHKTLSFITELSDCGWEVKE